MQDVSISVPFASEMLNVPNARFAVVCSLFGVILIARPEFLFGRASHETDIPLTDGTGHVVEGVDTTVLVTPAQRLTAVG